VKRRRAAEERAERVPIPRVEEVGVTTEPLDVDGAGLARPRRLRRGDVCACADERALHRRDADAHGLGRLLEREADHVLESERAPLHGRKRGEHLERRLHPLTVGRVLFEFAGFRHVRDHLHVAGRIDVPVLVTPEKIHRGVVRDAKEPGTERRRRLHFREHVPGLGQRVLHHVLAVEDRAGHACAVAVELGPNLGDEFEEARSRLRRAGQEIAHASGSMPAPVTAIALTPAGTPPQSAVRIVEATFSASRGTA